MNPKNTAINSLTSLRFFACLGIVLLHTDGFFGVPKNFFKPWGVTQGVSFFFVLSGFILAYSYPTLATPEKKVRFLARRFARIWPVHLLTFFFALAGRSEETQVSLENTGDFFSKAAVNLGLLQAWIPLRSWSFTFNVVSWSISDEFFFYLAFLPLLLPVMKRPRAALASAIAWSALGILAAEWSGVPAHVKNSTGFDVGSLFHVNPLVRLSEFVIGMAAARFFLGVRGEPRREAGPRDTLRELFAVVVCLGAVAGTTALARVAQEHTLPSLGAWLFQSGGCLAAAFLIYVFAFERGKLSAWLRHRYLVLAGEISFALYMTHNIFFLIFTKKHHPLVQLPLFLQLPAYLTFSVTVAWATFRFYEEPSRRWIAAFFPLRKTPNQVSLTNQ